MYKLSKVSMTSLNACCFGARNFACDVTVMHMLPVETAGARCCSLGEFPQQIEENPSIYLGNFWVSLGLIGGPPANPEASR